MHDIGNWGESAFTRVRRFWMFIVCSLLLGAAQAGPVQFLASGLLAASPSGSFALDFIDGSGAANQVGASGFTSNGTLGEGARTGSVSGDLGSGLLLRDTSLFSEALLDLVGADTFGFLFDATSLAPDVGEFGDSFSVFLLGAGGQSLLETDDPTGNNALLLFVVDGSDVGQLTAYSAPSTTE